MLRRSSDGKLREIVRLGHPVLRVRAEAVDPARFGTRTLRDLARDLIRTMYEGGGVGLAAPQIAVSQRVLAYYVPGDGGGEEVPATVLVNPVLTPAGNAGELGWEGCLSIPGLRGLVARHSRIDVKAFDVEGAPLEFTADGFHARVIQHEYDHLDGIVFLDRMADMTTLYYEEEWDRFATEKDLPVEV